MKQDKQLYFIAIIPSEPVYSEAQRYKELFAEQYESKAALKSPPHITLHMPFRLKLEKEELLIKVMSDLLKLIQPITICLNGFSQFNLRTIFIDVEDNEELHQLFRQTMRAMKVNFNIFNADYKNRGYNPHMTLAFRDLRKEYFKKAWPDFKSKEIRHEFMAEDVAILKHNGKNWEVLERLKMKIS